MMLALSSSRRGRIVAVAALVVAVALLVLLRRSEPVALPEIEAHFTPSGLLRVEQVAGRDLRILDEAGRLVAVVPAFGKESLEIRLAWQPGEAFRIVPASGVPLAVSAPEAVPALMVRLHAPLGQPSHVWRFAEPLAGERQEEMVVTAEPGESLDLMLEVEKLVDAGSYAVAVESSLSLSPESAELEFEFDNQVWLTTVTLGEELPEEPLVLRLRVDALEVELLLRVMPRNLAAEALVLERWLLPTSRDGHFEPRHVENQLTLPNALWVRLARTVGFQADMANYFEPYAYQTLWLRNGSEQPMSLLLEGTVVDPEGGEVLSWFQSPQIEATGGGPRILGFAQIPPGEVRGCVLPVYVDPDTPAGSYRRQVRASVLGTDRELKVYSAPLGIVRTQSLYTSWLIGIALLSGVWLVLALIFYRRLVASLGLRLLVLLALLGSLQFCLQFVGGMVANLFYALLGPFNCLVGGLLTEVMTYLIITCILYVVPRVGAMTLAGMVSYLMGAIMFGSFSAMDLLFIGSAIAFRELFLLLFGVTRFSGRETRAPKLLPMMLALALADAFSTFTNLVLQAIFYRLFFADWYILLQVVVTGFCYTLVGVWLGRRLGLSLRKVHV